MPILISLFGLLVGLATPLQDDTTAKAFHHYEAIRAALAADTVTDVAKHAAELAPLAEKVAGAPAKQAADGVAAAKDIKAAREHFGKLSAALLPVFEKARLAGVRFYTCPMEKQSWAQKGSAIQNPYYGKSMLTCGVPKK